MPIYEYHCQACNHQFEKIQKISEPLITVCPKCNQNKVQKLVSAPSFQLKGTGWYETDFKTKPQAKSAASTENADTKSEAKPAAAETKTESIKAEKTSDAA